MRISCKEEKSFNPVKITFHISSLAELEAFRALFNVAQSSVTRHNTGLTSEAQEVLSSLTSYGYNELDNLYNGIKNATNYTSGINPPVY